MAANMSEMTKQNNITHARGKKKDISQKWVKITSDFYYKKFHRGNFSLLNYLEWKKFRAALTTAFTQEDCTLTGDTNVIFISNRVEAPLRELFRSKITAAQLIEELKKLRPQNETKVKKNLHFFAQKVEESNKVEISTADYCALFKKKYSAFASYREWKGFRDELIKIFLAKDCSRTDDENVIFISKNALICLDKLFRPGITEPQLIEGLKKSQTPDEIAAKQREEAENYKIGQNITCPLKRDDFNASSAGIASANILEKLKEIERVNSKWTPPKFFCSTYFAGSKMSPLELCAILNKVKVFNREFAMYDEFSGKPKPHLRMNCKDINDTEVEEFISLLQECQVNACKGRSSDHSPIIIVEGVDNREEFLSAKEKLINFAQKHHSSDSTAIKPPGQ